MGHVQQSTTLAKELLRKADIYFLTKSDDLVIRAIVDAGFEVTALQNDQQILECLMTKNPDVVIFDKIDVDENLAKNIRTYLKVRLVIFTNLTPANRYAHIAVLPRAADLTTDAVSRFKNIAYTDDSTGTLYCHGPKYWVLRPEFLQYNTQGKRAPRETTQVLLAFGGSDPSNLTSVVLEELLRMKRTFRIDVVLGVHFSHENLLRQLLARYADQSAGVTLYRNIKNVAELMYKSDLAITSAGITMFEALCVGTPVVVIPQDQLQRDTYRGVMRMLESDEIHQLEDVIEKADFTYPLDNNIVEMKIGVGVPELVEFISQPV